jgi:transposase-like protein
VRRATDPGITAVRLEEGLGPLTKDLRPFYTAVDPTAATAALDAFVDWHTRYPAITRLSRAHWEEFTPFLGFPREGAG